MPKRKMQYQLSLVFDDLHTAHLQPIIGIPWLVPVPKKVTFIYLHILFCQIPHITSFSKKNCIAGIILCFPTLHAPSFSYQHPCFQSFLVHIRKGWLPLFGKGGNRCSERVVVVVRKRWSPHAMRSTCSWHEEDLLMA